MLLLVCQGEGDSAVVHQCLMSGPPRKVRLVCMPPIPSTRRDFLADTGRAATAGWLTLHLPWFATLAGCAREDARSDTAGATLTPAEVRTMRAFAAQIIPSDDGTPGAEEAGAVHFIEAALGRPLFADSAPIIRSGLADLDARARAVSGGARDFASLSGTHQVAIMREAERGPFFRVARTLVVIGTFADPSYGGNKDRIGWTMVGMEHRTTFSPPFGWYDAQADTIPTPRAI